MSTNGLTIKEKIAAHQANKPIALTRKQKEAAREELKKLTEQHAPKVIETLASFVKDRKIPASSRVAAGNLILERYAGKSAKLNEEERPEDSYLRMSESQLISTICESLWGLSSTARGAMAEALVMAEQGIRPISTPCAETWKRKRRKSPRWKPRKRPNQNEFREDDIKGKTRMTKRKQAPQGHHGTDIIGDRGRRYGTKVQEVRLEAL